MKSIGTAKLPNRVKAMYDFVPVEDDELCYVTGEIIVVTGMSIIGIYGVFIICVIGPGNNGWWHGYIESDPHRHGLFPSLSVKSIEN